MDDDLNQDNAWLNYLKTGENVPLAVTPPAGAPQKPATRLISSRQRRAIFLQEGRPQSARPGSSRQQAAVRRRNGGTP